MRKLYRSSRDRKLFGVCGGLAEYLGVDATLLRILLIIVAVFSAGSVVFVYIVAGFVIPREPFYGGYGENPYDSGWRGQEQPPYGAKNWNTAFNGQNFGPNPHAGGAFRSGAMGHTASSSTANGRPAQGIDAMMEDLEKKAMQREIEELRARITKFEKETKGE